MKTNDRSPQTIWQPINRKTQVAVTITALVSTIFQIYFWHINSIQSPSKPQPVQQLPEK